MSMASEKCEFCGCRGDSTICYYNCGCHKQNDKEVLPKKWPQETAVKLIDLGDSSPDDARVGGIIVSLTQLQ